MLEQPRPLLITILLGNLLVNIFMTSTATAISLDLFGERGLVYAFVAMSLLIMLFGEIVPKTLALHRSERAAPLIIYPLRLFYTIITVVRVPLTTVSNWAIDILRGQLGSTSRFLSWDELITALRISRAEGSVGMVEFELLSNVLRFREKVVKEIMTPSIHVVSLGAHLDHEEMIERFLESGHSRIPVYGASPDEIVGILHIKDLIRPDAVVTGQLCMPYVVPESMPIAQVYQELQSRKAHMAVCIDEYGSFVGVVTVEDVLEELVGEIRDARDAKTQPFMRIDENRIVIAGTMEIDEFNRVFGVDLEDDQHETMAGFVTGITGTIPSEGENMEAGGLRFHVLSAQPNRIKKMQVERIVEGES